MKFEWDPQKAENNLKKHGVSFQEAASVFGDALSMTYPDPDHSVGENRYYSRGLKVWESDCSRTYKPQRKHSDH